MHIPLIKIWMQTFLSKTYNSIAVCIIDLNFCETFEEFMRQYVMHIGDETNVVSRIAVKSHSPLLAVKHQHHSHEYRSCAQTFDTTLNDIIERIWTTISCTKTRKENTCDPII